MTDEQLQQAAAMLAPARAGGAAIGALPAGLRPRDEPSAYAVQAALHQHLEDAGRGRVVGHKIGCTTPVMQRYLGIAQPCAGGVFESTLHHASGSLRGAAHHRVGVECEVAVRLARDIERAPTSIDELHDAIDCVMAAMEIVDDRYADYRTLGINTLIADDFFNAGCVLGEAVQQWQSIDLEALRGRMWINQQLVGEGRGADIMGHPLNALAWLAGLFAMRGLTLRAGEFVLLGSLVQTQWLATGDEVRIDVSELGGATLTVS